MEQASLKRFGRFVRGVELSPDDRRFPPETANIALLFGSHRAYPARRQLIADGKPVEIGGRAFDLLMVLAAAPGELIGKQEILAAVWPHLHVEDANLRVQVAALRKALGNDRDLLRTVPGQGYSLNATVKIEGVDAVESAAVLEPVAPEPRGLQKTNLLAKLERVIGRQAELASVENGLKSNRLVVLMGPGGIGKTRLALELGQRAVGRFPDGAWLVDLAPISQGADLKTATATLFGLTLKNEETATETLAAFLAQREMLLIFDNCEHLVDPLSALIGVLLDRVPGLRVLATSQERLRIAQELTFQIGPLALPPEGEAMISGYGAVDLFVKCARSADRRFVFDEGEAASVADICRNLDGVPLAIEIAAAQLPALGIEGLRAGLATRLQMPAQGVDGGRYASLRAMVEWSYGLLDHEEQRLFRQLAIFAGGFSLEATAAVAGEHKDPWDTLDELGRLVDKSMVVVESIEPPRYRLLETLRFYAAELLAATGHYNVIAERHASYMAQYLTSASASRQTLGTQKWVSIHGVEIDNLRAARDWTLADPQYGPLAIKLAGAAGLMWSLLGLEAEARRHLDTAAELIDGDTPPADAAPVFAWSADRWSSSDRNRALELYERAASLYRGTGDAKNLGDMLAQMANLHMMFGRFAEAEAALSEAEVLLTDTANRKALCNVIFGRALLAHHQGDLSVARARYERARTVAREQNNMVTQLIILTNVAEIDFALGHFDDAIGHSIEAVREYRKSGDPARLSYALTILSKCRVAQGNIPEAATAILEAMPHARDLGGDILIIVIENAVRVAAADGQVEAAARLNGFVTQGFVQLGVPRDIADRATVQHIHDLLAARLPIAAMEALAAEGSLWTENQATDVATELVQQVIAAGQIGDL